MTVQHTGEIGLAELRQNASDVVRRVENGEEFVVTVSGRPAARLIAAAKKTWVTGAELNAIFGGLPGWGERDRGDGQVDDTLRDPWDTAAGRQAVKR